MFKDCQVTVSILLEKEWFSLGFKVDIYQFCNPETTSDTKKCDFSPTSIIRHLDIAI